MVYLHFSKRMATPSVRPKKHTSWFPDEKEDVRVTSVGCYSMTRWEDAKAMIPVLENLLRSHGISLDRAHIVDGTGNVGGDTIALGLACAGYGELWSVECRPREYLVLSHNVSQYDLPHVHVVCEELQTFWETVSSIDLLVIDPPWGGPDYKKQKQIENLYMQSWIRTTEVKEVINSIVASGNPPKSILLKVPRQYEESHLDQVPAKKAYVLDHPKFKWILFIF
jgi:predicted RNA methylase